LIEFSDAFMRLDANVGEAILAPRMGRFGVF